MGNVSSLKCRECGKEHLPTKIYACEECFGPLEVIYDYDSIELNRNSFKNRVETLWRYFELLPIRDESKKVDLGGGFTPLHKCNRLGEEFGIKNLYVKDDTVNPTGSFKDRPASIAVSKALEFGAKAVACPSTGNLAAAIAAHAAKAGLPCYLFVPSNIELEKIAQSTIYGAKIVLIKGTYDEANRLAAQAMEEFGWTVANINIRPYYVEGSKTLAFETCEQLGWRAPDRIIIPTASGGLLCATWKALQELKKVALIDDFKTKITCAQPEGCSPISKAFKSNKTDITPVECPNTIAKSLAIGDPGEGIYALKVVRESEGVAESVTDSEILEAMALLARREGIFTEPAGAVAIATLRKLVENGDVSRDEEVVCFVTGSGLKSTETILGAMGRPMEIEPSLEALSRVVT